MDKVESCLCYQENDIYDNLEKINGTAGEWVTDVVKDGYKKWKSSKPVFIDAGTGAGKNFFVLNSLVLDAYKSKQNVLILVNRTALSVQQQKYLNEKMRKIMPALNIYDKEPLINLEGKPKQIGNVILASYQSAIHFFKKDNMSPAFQRELKNVKYTIFDECDFFMSDAEFNEYVSVILKTCIKEMAHSIRIYMSATMDQVFIYLYEEEREFQKCNYAEICSFPDNQDRIDGFYYYVPKSYKSHNFYFFSKDDEIVTTIDIRDKEKFLIFVVSKSDGEDLQNKLKNHVSVDFINSDNKNTNEAFKKICAEEIFDERVIISTKLLDRGVNLLAEGEAGITNVVIGSFFDEYEIKQMIGRLRNNVNVKVNVFFQKITPQVIEKMKNRLITKQRNARAFRDLHLLKDQVRYLDRHKIPFREENGKLVVDKLFFKKIENDLTRINGYYESIENGCNKVELPFTYSKYRLIQEGNLKLVKEGVWKKFYDDLGMYTSYNEIMLSWFGKEGDAVNINKLESDIKQKWEEILSDYALIEAYDKKKYGNKNNFYSSDDIKNKCDSKNGTVFSELGNRIKENNLCKEDKVLLKSGDVIDYVMNAISKYNLNFKIKKDKAKLDLSQNSRVEIYYISKI